MDDIIEGVIRGGRVIPSEPEEPEPAFVRVPAEVRWVRVARFDVLHKALRLPTLNKRSHSHPTAGG